MTPDLYIAAFNAVAKNVREFLALLVDRQKDREHRADSHRELAWEGLIEVVRDLETHIYNHRELICKATAPILKSRDLPTTSLLIRKLVENDDLPDGYSHLKTAIRQYSGMVDLFPPPQPEIMGNLLQRVKSFQLAAFMIPSGTQDPDQWGSSPLPAGLTDNVDVDIRQMQRIRPSVVKLSAIQSAVGIVNLLNEAKEREPDKTTLWGLSDWVLKELVEIDPGWNNPLLNRSYETPEEVIGHVQLFCGVWRDKVKNQIHYGLSVKGWIGALQAERNNRS